MLEKEDLKGSHFILGNMRDNPASIYTKDYTKKMAEFDKSGLGSNPFRSNLKSDDNDPNQFLTTNKIKYQEWKNAEKAQLDPRKAHQLKTHHFSLGNYNNKSAQTTNQYYHNPKELSSEAGINSEEQKQRMRAHNHDFKEQPNSVMSSVYNQQYTRKHSAPSQAANTANSIRDTHIILGKDRIYMETTNGKDYCRKDPVYTAKAKIQTANLILGNAGNSFQTTNQMYHGYQQPSTNSLPEETMKELRGTHFSLGKQGNSYGTEANKYKAHPGYKPQKAFNPKLQNSSPLAPNGNFYGATTYKRQLCPRQLQSGINSKPEMQGNNFQLGNQGNSYTTEFSSNYHHMAGGPAASAKKVGPDAEGIIIGTDKNDYLTTHRVNYTTKDLNAARPTVDKTNFRGHHFNVGNTDQKHITVYQDEYREDQNNKSQMFHKVKI